MSSRSHSTRSWFPTRSKMSSWPGSIGWRKRRRRPSSLHRSSAGSLPGAWWTGWRRSGERNEEFLRELKAIELIYEKSLFPELSYMFKHALTHEVAYNSFCSSDGKSSIA